MSTRLQPYTLSFPQGYDEQAEFEAPFRGYLPGVIAGDPSRPMIGLVVVSRQEKDPFDGGRLRLSGVNLLAAKGHQRVALNWRHWCITSCLSSLSPSPRGDTP